jgi:hypothetical protein
MVLIRDEDRRDEEREILDEVLEHMDECARLLRSLRNEHLNAYCLAAFEGREGGWLGEFERDIIEAERKALDEEDDEEED